MIFHIFAVRVIQINHQDTGLRNCPLEGIISTLGASSPTQKLVEDDQDLEEGSM